MNLGPKASTAGEVEGNAETGSVCVFRQLDFEGSSNLCAIMRKAVKSLCWKQENWDIFIASQSAALKSSILHSFGSCEVLLQNKQKLEQVLQTRIYLGKGFRFPSIHKN